MAQEQSGPYRRRRILSLDGGGVRGAISVAFLERIEDILRRHSSAAKSPRLCDYFDLIGGTSTGAIIGTALALGMSTAEIKKFYFNLAPRIFRHRRFRLWLIQTLFDARALREEITEIVGERRLATPDLLTSLAIVTKRMDTGSAWIVTNNPKSKYWDDPQDRSYVGNRHYRLGDLVRASTAAPYYFAPHEIEIVPGESPGLFVDGGVSPHNNPALALFQVATIPAYGFGWPAGADELDIISIGTGSWRSRLSPPTVSRMPAIGLAIEALKSMSADSESQVLILMQILGHTDTPWTINSELGDLRGVLLPPKPLFTFERYDVRLEQNWLEEELGFSLDEPVVERLRMLGNATAIPLAYEIGQAAAEKFIKPEHLLM
jgi:hypothetical protein